MTGPMTPEREALIRVLQDAVWPFLAHDPGNPDLFWGQMARKVEEHYTAEVDRLRAQVAAVELVCIRAARHGFDPPIEDLSEALTSGGELASIWQDGYDKGWQDGSIDCTTPWDNPFPAVEAIEEYQPPIYCDDGTTL